MNNTFYRLPKPTRARELGGAGARELPLRAEGLAPHHAPEAPARRGRRDGLLPRHRGGARPAARRAALPAPAEPEARPRRASTPSSRCCPRAPARPSSSAMRPGRMPRSHERLRARGFALGDRGRRGRAAAALRDDGPWTYLRLRRPGYAPAELASWLAQLRGSEVAARPSCSSSTRTKVWRRASPPSCWRSRAQPLRRCRCERARAARAQTRAERPAARSPSALPLPCRANGLSADRDPRRRHLRPLHGHRAEARRHPLLHDLREVGQARRHLVRQQLSRRGLRRAVAALLVLLRAEPRLEPDVLAASRRSSATWRAAPRSTACCPTSASAARSPARRFDEAAGSWRLRTAAGESLTADVRGLGHRAAEPARTCRTSRASATSRARSSTRRAGTTAHDLAGENVVVIGNGASAIQFIPQIAPTR